MAAGNPRRAWLPEMIEKLKNEWKPSLTWEEFGSLCGRLTELRTKIRKERGIRGPRLFCRNCQEYHEMELGPVTIRAGLFALRKEGALTDEELQRMDVDWRRYRAKHRLDGRAQKRAEPSAGVNAE